jgi:hypothetical protein
MVGRGAEVTTVTAAGCLRPDAQRGAGRPPERVAPAAADDVAGAAAAPAAASEGACAVPEGVPAAVRSDIRSGLQHVAKLQRADFGPPPDGAEADVVRLEGLLEVRVALAELGFARRVT